MLIHDRYIRIAAALRLAAAVAVLVSAAAPALAADPLVGVWQGVGRQTPVGSHPDWTIVMTINANGGSIEYPSLSCGGTLTQLSRDGASAQFHETITHGQSECIDGGTVIVKLVNGKLLWSWTGAFYGTQYNASADVTAELVPRPSAVGGPR